MAKATALPGFVRIWVLPKDAFRVLKLIYSKGIRFADWLTCEYSSQEPALRLT